MALFSIVSDKQPHLLVTRRKTSMAAVEQSDNYYLELSKKNIRFEPVSAVTNVFFDDSNRQVCFDGVGTTCNEKTITTIIGRLS